MTKSDGKAVGAQDVSMKKRKRDERDSNKNKDITASPSKKRQINQSGNTK
jgi:hypothetical protein